MKKHIKHKPSIKPTKTKNNKKMDNSNNISVINWSFDEILNFNDLYINGMYKK